MFNVHKLFKTAASALIAIATLVGCSGTNARNEAATELLSQAKSLVDAHRYDSAIVVLDTLDKSFRDCLPQRREGTTVRLQALGALTRDSLAAAQMRQIIAQRAIDSLAPDFKKIDLDGTEGFFVDKNTFTGSETNATSLQLRVDPQGYMFLAVNCSKPIGLEYLDYDGNRTRPTESIKVENSEIMSVSQENCADFINALSQAKAPAKVALCGSKGNSSLTLNAKQLTSIARTADYARSLQTYRSASISLEKLERQLQRISDQLTKDLPE